MNVDSIATRSLGVHVRGGLRDVHPGVGFRALDETTNPFDGGR